MKLLACFFLFALLFLSKVALAPGFKGRMLEFQKFKEVKNSRQNHPQNDQSVFSYEDNVKTY